MNFEKIIYKYSLPKNFEDKKEFSIFKNVPDEICKKPQINFFKNIHISTNSVLFNYFKIIQKSCISEENFQQYSRGYKFFLKFIFPKFNFSKKKILVITDEWTSNYYHWHIFALQKLTVLKEENLIANSLLFLPKKYQKYPFVLSSLEKFGIKKNQIIFLRRKSNIKASEAPLVEISQHHPIIFQHIQQTLLQNCPKINHNFGDKIYISREGQSLRKIENEKDMLPIFEKYGFKKVIMDTLSYDQQINIARDAKHIISPHGAGLTNILFMSQGCNILELATKPNPSKPITDYYKLATMLNINYFYQECEMHGAKAHDYHQTNLLVNLEKLEKNIKLMLSIAQPEA